MDIFYAAQRVLLDAYGPPSVLVNAEGDIIYLVATDVGRPIGHFATNLRYDRLIEDARQVWIPW